MSLLWNWILNNDLNNNVVDLPSPSNQLPFSRNKRKTDKQITVYYKKKDREKVCPRLKWLITLAFKSLPLNKKNFYFLWKGCRCLAHEQMCCDGPGQDSNPLSANPFCFLYVRYTKRQTTALHPIRRTKHHG